MNQLEIKPFDNIQRFLNSSSYAKSFQSYQQQNEHKILMSYKNNQGSKRILNFHEFYIDGIALSERLDHFYKNPKPLVDSWIVELGVFPRNPSLESMKAKSFLKEPVSESEILDYLKEDYFSNFTKRDLEYQLFSLSTEFEDEASIFYACQTCIDYACGGYKGKISKENGQYLWQFELEDQVLEFYFEEQQYRSVFAPYLK